MENILKNINAVLGVTGCFVCDNEGQVLASALPDIFDDDILSAIGRIVTQTVAGLATSRRRRVVDIDLVYSQSRFIAKYFGKGCLCVLCVRDINLPLLNLTAKMVTKRLIPMVDERRLRVMQDAERHEAWASAAQMLNGEVLSILSAALEQGVVLKASGDAAIRLHCPSAGRMALDLDDKILALAGLGKQSAQISQVMESLGYSPEVRFNILYGEQRLRYVHPEKNLGIEVFLNELNMYHQLNFVDRLSSDENTLPLADLLLWNLQYQNPDDGILGVIYAVLCDHMLGEAGEVEKIDTERILDLCANDWGWYKSVSMNLNQCINWVKSNMGEVEPAFLERANRLLQLIEETPKTVRWQLRARIGESMRWYEIPE
jgi:predicted regulator of Ras-like GTPase activity (Roadblock/LC7/MglB family)